MAVEQQNVQRAGSRSIGYRAFREHPNSLGMSWWGHGVGAARIGGRLLGAGAACMIHAIVPSWFTQTAGRTVSEIHDEMLRRKASAANPNEWPDYEI